MLRLLAFLLLLPTLVLAQSAPRTILVLDGSGSMWGQIDGVNKIVIARDVMADLLATLPPDEELGLMSYGHRRKGDCSDIELILAPGTDRSAIARAVNSIKPKGKTPLSAAVIAAAEALKFTEEAATVILVSDGIETCNLDPCAVGRELEAAGVAFTAHVIGFDVGADPAAQAQLRCLAQETGGLYRDAANADELAGALKEIVVAEPEPEPMPVSTVVTFRAIDGPTGPEIADGLIWNIRTEAAGEIIVNDDDPRQLLDIFPSTGLAEVTRVRDEASAEARFTVEEGAGPMTITLVLPEFLPPASVSGPAEAPVGATIAVNWTGPNGVHDAIFVAAVGETNESHQGKAYTADGTPAQLRLPMTPGRYEIRYVMNDGAEVLARAPITLVETGARLDAAATAPAGSELSVGWQGPDYDRDFIAIVPRGEDRRARLSYAYTGNGNPARFTAPLDPGAYDLLYIANDNGTTELARRPITIEAVRASLEAPTSAPAGATLTVGFTGGGSARDMITLARPDDGPGTYETYERVREGQSVSLDLPAQSGAYELRYVQHASGKAILARQPLEITPVAVTLTAPSAAPAGTRIEVGFDGPGYARDFIVFARPGEAGNKRTETGYPRNGNPAAITTPREPGEWELRYLLGGAYGVIAARQPFTVTPAE